MAKQKVKIKNKNTGVETLVTERELELIQSNPEVSPCYIVVSAPTKVEDAEVDK